MPRRAVTRPPDPNAELVARLQSGDRQAGEALLLANTGLIALIARALLHRAGCLELDDLLQEGRIGLLNAAERFDPALGYQFSTYAMWWVRQGIGRAVEAASHLIRVPPHLRSLQRKTLVVRETLTQEQGREPGENEVARVAGLTPRQAQALQALPQVLLSLDDAISAKCSTALGDTLAGDVDLESRVVEQVAVSQILAATTLSARERSVVELRFGLHGGVSLTLPQVAAVVGMTSESARHCETRALKKLRAKAAE